MYDIVMIKVVHYIVPLKFAIVIVCVHICGHWLVQGFVQVAYEVAALFRAKIEHEDKPAHVDKRHSYDQAIHALEDRAEAILWIGL